MAAEENHFVAQLHAARHHHVVAGGRFGNERVDEVLVIEAVARAKHVRLKEFRRILDALGLLHAASGKRHLTGVDDGVAAEDGHFFEDEHALGAVFKRAVGGRETGKARADDDDFKGFLSVGGVSRPDGFGRTGDPGSAHRTHGAQDGARSRFRQEHAPRDIRLAHDEVLNKKFCERELIIYKRK